MCTVLGCRCGACRGAVLCMPDGSLLVPSQVILGSERLGGTLRLEGAVAQVKGTGQIKRPSVSQVHGLSG